MFDDILDASKQVNHHEKILSIQINGETSIQGIFYLSFSDFCFSFPSSLDDDDDVDRYLFDHNQCAATNTIFSAMLQHSFHVFKCNKKERESE